VGSFNKWMRCVWLKCWLWWLVVVVVEKSRGGGLVDMAKNPIKYITMRDFFGKNGVNRSTMFPYQPLSSSSLDEADKVETKVRRKIWWP